LALHLWLLLLSLMPLLLCQERQWRWFLCIAPAGEPLASRLPMLLIRLLLLLALSLLSLLPLLPLRLLVRIARSLSFGLLWAARPRFGARRGAAGGVTGVVPLGRAVDARLVDDELVVQNGLVTLEQEARSHRPPGDRVVAPTTASSTG
jgi:hypothetical protein